LEKAGFFLKPPFTFFYNIKTKDMELSHIAYYIFQAVSFGIFYSNKGFFLSKNEIKAIFSLNRAMRISQECLLVYGMYRIAMTVFSKICFYFSTTYDSNLNKANLEKVNRFTKGSIETEHCSFLIDDIRVFDGNQFNKQKLEKGNYYFRINFEKNNFNISLFYYLDAIEGNYWIELNLSREIKKYYFVEIFKLIVIEEIDRKKFQFTMSCPMYLSSDINVSLNRFIFKSTLLDSTFPKKTLNYQGIKPNGKDLQELKEVILRSTFESSPSFFIFLMLQFIYVQLELEIEWEVEGIDYLQTKQKLIDLLSQYKNGNLETKDEKLALLSVLNPQAFSGEIKNGQEDALLQQSLALFACFFLVVGDIESYKKLPLDQNQESYLSFLFYLSLFQSFALKNLSFPSKLSPQFPIEKQEIMEVINNTPFEKMTPDFLGYLMIQVLSLIDLVQLEGMEEKKGQIKDLLIQRQGKSFDRFNILENQIDQKDVINRILFYKFIGKNVRTFVMNQDYDKVKRYYEAWQGEEFNLLL